MNNENDSTIQMWWKRLTKERFDETEDQLLDRQVSMNDYEAVLRGKWKSRRYFLMSCIGYCVALGNMLRFPRLVHMHGVGAFVILHIFFSFTFGLPLLILEMGLGQFTSMSNTKAFKCVPILFGVAWSQVNLIIIMTIYYGVPISWDYIFLVDCFKSPLPWSSCNNTYNTQHCLLEYNSSLGLQNDFYSSHMEYFQNYVLGMIRPDGTRYQMNEPLGPIESHRLVSWFFVWLLGFMSIMSGIKISSIVVHFTALLPYFLLCFLFILGCTLPGGAAGLLFFLKPNMTAFIQPFTYIRAIDSAMSSLLSGFGVYMSLSSHNDFHDNFLRDGVCLILVDCMTSLLSGFTGLALIGHLAYTRNVTIENMFPIHILGIHHLIYTKTFATVYGCNLVTTIFIIAAILLGMDTHFIMLESVMTSFIDIFIRPDYIFLFRLIGSSTICTICFLCGLIYITSAGIRYYMIFGLAITCYATPIIIIIQCMTIGIIYGRERLRKDFKMMLGFALPKYVFIAIAYYCPLCCSINMIYVLVRIIPVLKMNALNCFIFFGSILFIFAPLIIGSIYTMVIHHFRNEQRTLDQYIHSLINPPIYYGPKYKINWLLDTEYKEKLIKYRKNPEFLKHVCPIENINIIYNAIKQARTTSSYRTQTSHTLTSHTLTSHTLTSHTPTSHTPTSRTQTFSTRKTKIVYK